MRRDGKGRPLFDEILEVKDFVKLLTEHFDLFTGVPDSMYGAVLPLLSNYIAASRENHAVGIAFGAALAGKKACVLMQNSGLGLCGDALLGLQRLHQTGVVLFVTQRGELEWEEIQHHDWAECTEKVLKAYDIEFFDYNELGAEAVSKAAAKADTGCIAAVLLHRGNINESS
ncbi:hypothetical protein [Maridesulfovibrio hydrothermalis]|uniref:Thiamine pyrophosphate enzyme N-terminal TPP-binding domain-containing protein n=1 Tax=Maridesulfovibrio hydrothermalis AM13 = DSM 14728 TaxID=1121451 RepID=L0RBM9_9BACT|nr:hypothetical protein [Maridesulfovibrio hydrothermalis]CCO23590.1 protein of unknown function [Maridesulfovibrio hydrothermalis AM13 = DSM 14728]